MLDLDVDSTIVTEVQRCRLEIQPVYFGECCQRRRDERKQPPAERAINSSETAYLHPSRKACLTDTAESLDVPQPATTHSQHQGEASNIRARRPDTAGAEIRGCACK
jgi:hypothetical protein